MKRESFGGRFAVLVAMVGSAVGLGNLWRFPYLVGRNGGAAFIIVYLVIALIICLPIMLSEEIIGRRSESNVYGAFRKLAPKSKWNIVGIISLITPILIMSFYCVVGGWIIYYLMQSCTFHLVHGGATDPDMFGKLATRTWTPMIYAFIFLFLTGFIISRGVQKGIEKYSKFLMPLLFFCTLGIAIYSMTLPGSSEGLRFLFKPDFSKLSLNAIFEALGQAFFSLSLGSGLVITYSSYIKKNESLVYTAFSTSIMDTIFALLAGMAIMPAVFAFGMEPSQGPSLIFITIPLIFAKMATGPIVAVIFFFVVFVAAITSSISLLEIVTSFACDQYGWSRKNAVIIITSLVVLPLMVICSLSTGVLSNFTIFGKNIFDLFDYVSANVCMILCALAFVIFVGWKLKYESVEDELSNHGSLRISPALIKTLFFLIKWVAPIAITAIIAMNFM